MKVVLFLVALIGAFQSILTEEVRLLDLEPTDAQQVIEKQDQSLHYAPKIESNVPAIRFLGNEPHHVQEDIYLAKQYHGQDGIGGYLYGYNVPDIAKTERKKAGGDLRGAYNYISGGKEIKVEYWDDGHGFHQIDNVPKILPKQIDDSPEVKAEKEKFLARWHEEAERNTHPVVDPFNSEGQYASGPLSVQGQLEFKKQFQTSQYQQNGQYQQPGQYQQTGQYQQPGQYQQTGQYQQPGQQFGQQPGQYTSAQNQIDYTGQYSENKNVYSKPSQDPNIYQQSQPSGQYQQPQQGQYQPGQSQQSGTYQKSAFKTDDQIDDSGKYVPRPEDEDTTGPPKGFFYSFDYPVGIIVNKQGLAKREGVKDVYNENKTKFEAQLQSGHTDGSSQSGYLYVKN